MKRTTVAGFFLFLTAAACGPVKPNVPPTPPTPPADPSPVCEAGATCGCWHRPPGSAWLQLPPCGQAPPVVLPPTVPATGLIPDEELLLTEETGCKTWAAVDAAIFRWRAANPLAWNLEGTCLSNGPAGIDAAFAGFAEELRKSGVPAGQSISKEGQRSDALFVQRAGTALWEEMHLFDYGRACVATGPNAVRRIYRRAASPGVPPPTAPPPVVPPPSSGYMCAAPEPPPLRDFNLHCQNSDGSWKKWCDATPQVYGCGYKGAGTNFCDEIGLGEMPGQPGVVRCDCAAGNEDAPEARECREAWIVGGKPLWKTDGSLELHPENLFLARCSECKELSICKADGTKCTTVRLVQ